MTETLDATDWAILAELQQDGRIPHTELGRRVNLSASATTERVKRLESTYRVTRELLRAKAPRLAAAHSRLLGVLHAVRPLVWLMNTMADLVTRPLGLGRVGDLLDHRPRRYEEPVPEKRIAELWGEDEVVIAGQGTIGLEIRVRQITGSVTCPGNPRLPVTIVLPVLTHPDEAGAVQSFGS